MLRCLAIFREITNSPNREQDDALILKAVVSELTALGMDAHLIEPQNIGAINPEEWDLVLPMCENYPALMKVKSWEGKGPLVINPMEAVFNCYRTNMTPLMNACPGVHPKTEIRPLKDIPGKHAPEFFDGRGAWLKRGDVHNTCDHDVVFVKQWNDCDKVRQDFESREIVKVVIQEHIPGDVIKFYGVGPFKWFNWFYHRPDEAKRHPFPQELLERNAGEVARAVGLEVFGGDAIVTPEGRIYVIDINSWPSFARVREEVKTHIARHVFERAANAKKERHHEKRNTDKRKRNFTR